MNIREINHGIYMMSESIEQMLFEGMWDLPQGVTLNAYIVKGDKTAIIDGVIDWDGVPESLIDSFSAIGVDPQKIDYVIVNHMEPDHSGWLENFKKINPDFTLMTTKKGAPMVKAFYQDDITVKIVGEGDTIDLGQGKILSFHPTPNVHWPETMMTFEQSTKTLFSCDMYGAFGTMKDHLFDDEMTETEKKLFALESARYFSNVLTTFSTMAERAIQKTLKINPTMIAPGHGPVYRQNIKTIIERYQQFCQFAKGKGQREITVLWGSMYGMTAKAVSRVVDLLKERGISVNQVRLPESTQSDMVMHVFRSAAIVIAAPTYEYKLFPPIAQAMDELGRKKISQKQAFYLGSYGWSGGAERELMQLVEQYKMNWHFIEPLLFEGAATEATFETLALRIDQLIDLMATAVIE